MKNNIYENTENLKKGMKFDEKKKKGSHCQNQMLCILSNI